MAKPAGMGMKKQSWSARMADTVIARHPLLSRRWHYEPGIVLLALHHLWQQTGDRRYYDYVRGNIDQFVGPNGEIRTYRPDEYNIDQINEGKLLFPLYETTGDERYRKAIYLLRGQLATHPRTAEGGYWHKLVYPHQTWLDGAYMAMPFYAEFARRFDEPGGFDDVADQIVLMAGHTRDPKSGLFYHGWDETRSQRWADPLTGCSPHFWGRAMGWYAMTFPDVLDHFPQDHPQLGNLLAIFSGLAAAAIAVQDEASGVWYQVLDQGSRDGNYPEASASCMFVYALAKGVRKGYLDPAALVAARRGYDGILSQFVTVGDSGLVNLHSICSVGGLGGKPYRDGSFEYYVGEKVISNDLKGIGAFMLASLEMELANHDAALAL